MATFRPVTDGAGQEIGANLDAILKRLQGQSASAADSADYTGKQLLTEETGREIASKIASIMTALASYIAPSAKKVQNKLTIGESSYDGSAALTAPNASTSQPGLMSKDDKSKLDGIAAGANKYSLPLAASGTRGGVQVGYTQSGKNYPVQLSNEKMYVNVPWTDTTYSAATQSAAGLLSAADKKKLDGIAENANNYSLPLMTSSVRGGAKIGFTQSGKKYPVQLSDEKMFVEVPWENTTYSNATQSAAGLLSASDKAKLDGITASADSVSFSRSLTSGTKIGTITINGTATDMYCQTNTDTKYSAGSGIALNGTTFSLKTLEDMTWSEISAISKAGKAASIFHVGQEKKITLSTGEEVTAVILGFNHDDLSDGTGKAGITFGLKNALKTTYPMNSSNTNSGGWGSSAMRTRMSTFKGYLPSDLQSSLRKVDKKTSAGSSSSSINTTEDELFLFSHIEVFGTYYYDQGSSPSQYSYSGEGKQYEYYKGKTWCSYYQKYTIDTFGTARTYSANRYYQENGYKGLGDAASSAYAWWLRSPYEGSSSSFCCLYGGGCVSFSGGSYGCGAVFGFCV